MLSQGSIMESASCPDEIPESYSKINGTNRKKVLLKTSEDMKVTLKNIPKIYVKKMWKADYLQFPDLDEHLGLSTSISHFTGMLWTGHH